MILTNMKNQIKPGYIVSGLIALIITVISMGEGKTIIEYKNFMFTGLSFLFLLFSNEMLKESLVEEKRSKRLEYLLGNGMSINKIFINYFIPTYVLTTLLLIPSLIYLLMVNKVLITEVYFQIIELLVINFLVLSINILLVLYLKNLNTMRHIFLLLTFVLFLYNGFKFIIKELYPMHMFRFISIFGILLFIIAVLIFYNLTKERVIASYS